MNNIWADVITLKQSIDALLLEFPELAEDEVLREDTFEAETSFNEVIAHLCSKAQEADSYIEGIKLRANDLAARKARFERQRDGLRRLMQGLLERAGMASLKLPEATLSLSYRHPEPIVTDEEAVPEELKIITAKPDMRAIKNSYTVSGELPAGCTLSNGKRILTIRSR